MALDYLQPPSHPSRRKRNCPRTVVINAEAAEEYRGEVFPSVGVAEHLVVGEFAARLKWEVALLRKGALCKYMSWGQFRLSTLTGTGGVGNRAER